MPATVFFVICVICYSNAVMDIMLRSQELKICTELDGQVHLSLLGAAKLYVIQGYIPRTTYKCRLQTNNFYKIN